MRRAQWIPQELFLIFFAKAVRMVMRDPYIEDFAGSRYGIMYYKNSNAIGVRQKFGEKRQILSFGGKKSNLSESSLRSWGDSVVMKLEINKWSEKKAGEWVKAIIAESS
jgi:hypothetical protein